MNREQLSKYKKNKRDIENLDGIIAKLQERLDAVPVVKEYAGILGQIQQIEDALTRVQAKKQKAIEAIHKFGYDDAKLELATMQLELQIMKQDGGSHETEDDGFMDAMNATASEVWGDQDV